MSILDTPSPTSTVPPWPERRPGMIATACRDLVYLTGVLSLSIVGFVIWTCGVSLTASLIVFVVVGAVVGLAFAQALRWTADVDRLLAGWYLGRPVHGRYRSTPKAGLRARVRTVSRDPRTWRDLAWSIGNSTLGFFAAGTAITVSAVVFSYAVMPLWWWAITDPHQQYGTLNLGAYTVTSLPLALLTSAIGLVLAPLALSLNHAVARSHARVAKRALSD